MKKYTLPILISLCLGIFMAYFIIHQYESLDSVSLSTSVHKIYYIQSGVYSDKKNMEDNMKDFSNYIYNISDNMYYSYVGLSTSKTNAEKIQKYFKEVGYDTFVKEKMIDNSNFIEILSQYDDILSKTTDNESIKVICSQVLSKYEEYINGKYND